VDYFGNHLFQLEEHFLTDTDRVALIFCELENFDLLVHRYLNTGKLLFEQFSEDWWYNGET